MTTVPAATLSVAVGRLTPNNGRAGQGCDRHGAVGPLALLEMSDGVVIVGYLFGVTGTKAPAAMVEHIADPIRVERALTSAPAVRGLAETRHAAKSWKLERRVVAQRESA